MRIVGYDLVYFIIGVIKVYLKCGWKVSFNENIVFG